MECANTHYLNKYLDKQQEQELELEYILGSTRDDINELVSLYESIIERASSMLERDYSDDIREEIRNRIL